jgi:hypothetical protein
VAQDSSKHVVCGRDAVCFKDVLCASAPGFHEEVLGTARQGSFHEAEQAKEGRAFAHFFPQPSLPGPGPVYCRTAGVCCYLELHRDPSAEAGSSSFC